MSAISIGNLTIKGEHRDSFIYLLSDKEWFICSMRKHMSYISKPPLGSRIVPLSKKRFFDKWLPLLDNLGRHTDSYVDKYRLGIFTPNLMEALKLCATTDIPRDISDSISLLLTEILRDGIEISDSRYRYFEYDGVGYSVLEEMDIRLNRVINNDSIEILAPQYISHDWVAAIVSPKDVNCRALYIPQLIGDIEVYDGTTKLYDIKPPCYLVGPANFLHSVISLRDCNPLASRTFDGIWHINGRSASSDIITLKYPGSIFKNVEDLDYVKNTLFKSNENYRQRELKALDEAERVRAKAEAKAKAKQRKEAAKKRAVAEANKMRQEVEDYDAIKKFSESEVQTIEHIDKTLGRASLTVKDGYIFVYNKKDINRFETMAKNELNNRRYSGEIRVLPDGIEYTITERVGSEIVRVDVQRADTHIEEGKGVTYLVPEYNIMLRELGYVPCLTVFATPYILAKIEDDEVSVLECGAITSINKHIALWLRKYKGMKVNRSETEHIVTVKGTDNTTVMQAVWDTIAKEVHVVLVYYDGAELSITPYMDLNEARRTMLSGWYSVMEKAMKKHVSLADCHCLSMSAMTVCDGRKHIWCIHCKTIVTIPEDQKAFRSIVSRAGNRSVSIRRKMRLIKNGK